MGSSYTTLDPRDASESKPATNMLEPGQPGYDDEVAGFNEAIVHRPAFVLGARTTEDIVDAVRFARAQRWRVSAHNTGHGTGLPVDGGLLVSMRHLDQVQIDAAKRAATAGGGARWGAVIASAAPHGLAPITGSSPSVGVVGFLLGGGIGPLVRSHGFGSDYLERATLVTGSGEVIAASANENSDLLWALRGGKPMLGIVTEVRVRLVALPALYAGSLVFEERHLEDALRGWIAWTADADPRVTTSVAIVHFPARETVPPPLRGRRMLTVRFAYAGEAAEGARLAAPLRAIAPVESDALGAMPIADVAHIFDDPTEPVTAWSSAGLLARVDQDLASALLAHVGAGHDSPFFAAELRHLGEATTRDVPGGSAVGGRWALFTFGLIGTAPSDFAEALPRAEARLVDDLARWVSPEVNGNFHANPHVRRTTARAGADVRAKLADLARRYDPDGLFR